MMQRDNERLYHELNRIAYNTLAGNALLGDLFRTVTISVQRTQPSSEGQGHRNVLGFTIELASPHIIAWLHMPSIRPKRITISYDDIRPLAHGGEAVSRIRRYAPNIRHQPDTRMFPPNRPDEHNVQAAWRLFVNDVSQWILDNQPSRSV